MIVRGEGCYLEDVEGKRYLDGLAGLFAVQIGYSYGDEIGQAAHEQMRELPFYTNWSSAHPRAIELAARQDDAVPDGVVFIPFAFVEAAANLLTNPALDPFGKIPEFKYCAVRVKAGGQRPGDPGYGKGRTLEELYG